MSDPALIFAILIIGVALAFDFVNGFHDAANSIATVVSTRVLTPLQGVVWAAVFNFIAAFTFGTAVAKTVGSGLVDVNQVDSIVIFSGLVGAITWDLITWWLGLPTSSSHALIGGYAGAAILKAGFVGADCFRLGENPLIHRHRPAVGLVSRLGDHHRGFVGVPQADSRRSRTAISGAGSWYPPRSTAWVTAQTMLKRRWGSSPV